MGAPPDVGNVKILDTWAVLTAAATDAPGRVAAAGTLASALKSSALTSPEVCADLT